MSEHDAIEQLAALLDGADVPDAPSSLGALATLATTVRDHADVIAPTADFRRDLRAEVVALADAPPSLVERTRAAWAARTAGLRTSARVAVATATATSMIGSAGVAVAAQDAMPGELLYGVKALTEDARLLLATDAVAEARLHLAFARERLEELRRTAGQLDTDEVVALLAEMDAHSEAGAEALLTGVAEGTVDPNELRDWTTGQRDGLVSVLDDLPLPAKPVAEDSLELLRRIEVNAADVTGSRACDCDGDGLLDSLEPARRTTGDDATDTTARTGARGPRLPLPGNAVDVVLPGDGPAQPERDCDCIELPGGEDAREPDRTRGEESGADAESTPEEEPEREPFQPTGELSDPETDNDEEGGEDVGVDAPSALEPVPTDEATETADDAVEPAEDGTGVDVGTGPAERVQQGVDDLLDQ